MDADGFQEDLAVALELHLADAGELAELVECVRAVLHHGRQRAVVEDDVRGHALLAGQVEAERAECVEKSAVVRGLRQRDLGFGGFGFLLLGLRPGVFAEEDLLLAFEHRSARLGHLDRAVAVYVYAQKVGSDELPDDAAPFRSR